MKIPILASLIVSILFAVFSSVANAQQGRIYWADYGTGVASPGSGFVAWANLDGSDAHLVNTTGCPTSMAQSIALDPVNEKVYWTQYSDDGICFANLDNQGSSTVLNTGGTRVFFPTGLAINRATNRIYWTSLHDHSIHSTNLDNTGSGNTLDTDGKAKWHTSSLAIDSTSNKLYFGGANMSRICSTNLDETGSTSCLNLTGPPYKYKTDALVVLPDQNRIIWANREQHSIFSADLSTGVETDIPPPYVSDLFYPTGLAANPATNSLYVADYNGVISRLNLDGTGSGQALNITGVTPVKPRQLAILLAPEVGGTPNVIPDGGSIGQLLTCSVTFAPDLLGAQLYREPATVTYQWQKNGVDIDGATTSTFQADEIANYSCKVSGSNIIGSSATVSSAAVIVAEATPQPTATPIEEIIYSSYKPKIRLNKNRAKIVINDSQSGKWNQCVLVNTADESLVIIKRIRKTNGKLNAMFKNLRAGSYKVYIVAKRGKRASINSNFSSFTVN